ncbi:MAG: hypothetical protein ACK4PK_03555 [Alphaproteobacteria bacterium]
MNLSELEKDILGDMQFDTHELWEWYSFIRTHYPSMSEDEVIEFGYNLFVTWVGRDWLIFYKSRQNSNVLTSSEFLQLIQSMGKAAANPEHAATVLELSRKASKDVSWLKPMNTANISPEKE